MDGSAATPELSYRSLTLERGAADKVARTIRASLSSEAPYTRFGETEILSHEPGAIDLSRAKDGLPLLFGHNHEQPIGIVEDVKLEAKTLRGTLRFGRSARAEEVFQDVIDGTLRNVSIGYQVLERQKTKDGYIAKRFAVFEASIVAVPADYTVGINRATTQGNKMEPNNVTQTPATQTREYDIRACVKAAKLDDSFADQLLTSGVTIDRARDIVIDRLADNDARFPVRSQTSIDGYQGDSPSVIAGMSEALASRHGCVALTDVGRPYQGLRVVDMARQILELRGIKTTSLNASALIERAGMHTTSDFSQLLLATGDRVLRQGYASYLGGLKRIARSSTARDFRNKTRVQLGQFPELLQVNEHGEVTQGSTGESFETYRLRTYGRIFSLTREALINDDLGAFTDSTARFGRSAAELEAKILVDLLASNPVMADGLPVFHPSHSNLEATGTAISIASLGAARQAMRLQKGLGGLTPIDVQPKYLVVPANLETVAAQFLTLLVPNQATSANPFAGALDLVVDPRLDKSSATAWYLAADPGGIETLEYAYLEGAPGPQTSIRVGFDIMGLELRCTLDYGAAVLDFRGLYKNPGV